MICGWLHDKKSNSTVEFEFHKFQNTDSCEIFTHYVYSVPSIWPKDSSFFENSNYYGFDNCFQNGWKKYYVKNKSGKESNILLWENYKNGMLNGEITGYYNNGKIFFTGQYEDNARIGEWTLFYETGKKMREGRYLPKYLTAFTLPLLDKDSLKIYIRTEDSYATAFDYYHERIRKYTQRAFNSVWPFIVYSRDGVWKNWDEKGNLIDSVIFENGEIKE